MQLFIERYVLPVCAAAFIAVFFVNSMKFDWTQRITFGLAVCFFAYFVAHTAIRSNKQQADDSASVNLLEEKSSQSASPITTSQSSTDDQKISVPALSNTNIPASSPAQPVATAKSSPTPPPASAREPEQSRNLPK
ncbi:MAG TPA: hypothetical protein VM911_02905 [Pyrinomonadaceae bacterium]|nr:hypothetical protein [Pyrinomonadaceae bacterium]